jgi:hypothetical protein
MLGFDAPVEDIEITDVAPAEQNLVLNSDFPISQKFDFLFYTLSSLVRERENHPESGIGTVSSKKI